MDHNPNPDPADAAESLSRSLTRREALGRGAVGAAGMLGIGSVLAACGGGGGGSTTASSNAPTAATGSGEITIGAFKASDMDLLRKFYLPRFTKETGITVKLNETSYSTWYQNAKNDGLQKTGAYDIYIMDDSWVPEFAAAQIIQNLDEIGLKANPDIMPKALHQGYWPQPTGARMKDFADAEPALYALVIINDLELLFYRNDFFDGPPKTWDEIYKKAEQETVPGKMWGWSARGVKGNPIVQTYLPLLNSYGGSFVTDDWAPGFAGPEGIAALERLLSFIPYMPNGVAEFDTDQEVATLLNNRCIALTEYAGLTKSIDDPAASKVVGKIDVTTCPEQESGGGAIGTFVAGISVSAPNTPGAVKFLEWFTSDAIQGDFALAHGQSAVTKGALSNPEATKKYRWLPAFLAATEVAVPKPWTPDEPKLEDILGTRLNEALTQAVAQRGGYHAIAEKALTAAANETTAFLKQQGGYL